ncbi:MAG: zinc ribbon domain-containing protein [Pyrinomonadaceae bacterium]|nr:zinc ribbon domain-containing protein [Pyrinomonadaceae bacterium]
MYCPRCAKQHVEAAKFCRDCGTDLDTVALALDGKLVLPIPASQGSENKSNSWDAPNKGWEDRYNNPQTTQDWLRKQSAGMNFLARGATLLAAVLLTGVVMLRLFGVSAWPLLIWAGAFGWMGCWGVAYMAEGLGAMMQSRNMLRGMGPIAIESDTDPRARMVSATVELQRFPDVTIAPETPRRLSVTENTTAELNKQHPRG